MKIKNYLWLLTPIFISLVPVFLWAQDDEEEEVYELSPFLIQDREVQGYLATTTLAGTRIKTQIKDVGASISVLTQEFMDDLGSTDAGTLLNYTLGTEVGGEQGIYAGQVQQDNFRINPQNHQRIRGLTSATLTRNYFRTDLPYDRYNISSVTINRGPNSLLFGIGSAGGVIESSTTKATVSDNFGQVSLRLGERGSSRASFNVNQVLIEDRLAVRVAGLKEDIQYQQEPAFEDDSRFYVDMEAVLNKGGNGVLGRTVLRANYEWGEIESNRPNPVPQTSNLSSYFEAPDYDKAVKYHSSNIGQKFGPAQALARRWWWLEPGTPDWVYKARVNHNRAPTAWGVGLDGTEDPKYFTDDGIGTETTLAMIAQPYLSYDDHTRGTYEAAGFPGDPNAHGIQGGLATTYLMHFSNHFHYGNGFSAPSLPYEIFDNNNLLFSGNANSVLQEFETTNVTLEQQFNDILWGNIGVEIAHDEQTYETDSVMTFSQGGAFAGLPFIDSAQTIRVDLNETTVDRNLNPNFGRPVIESDSVRNENYSKKMREATRVTAFYEVDFNKEDTFFQKLLGRHVLSGLYQEESIESPGLNHVYRWEGSAGFNNFAWGGSVGPSGGWDRTIKQLTYLGPSLLGDNIQKATDWKLTEVINNPVIQDGQKYTIRFKPVPTFPNANNGFFNTEWRSEQLTARRTIVAAFNSKIDIDSKVAAWQGFWADGHIVTLYGWREDESRQTRMVGQGGDDGFPLMEDGTIDPRQATLRNEADAPIMQSTYTKSVVAHLPDDWNPISDFASISGFWSLSDNFNPVSVRSNVFGEQIGSPVGETEEYGVTFGLFDERLSIRVGRFESTEGDSNVPFVNSIIHQKLGDEYVNFWTGARREWREQGVSDEESFPQALEYFKRFEPETTANINWTSYDEAINALRMIMHPTARANVGGTEAREDGTLIYNILPGVTGLQDRSAEGYEIDVVGQITQNWSVSFNWQQIETLTTNVLPLAQEYVAYSVPYLKETGIWGGGLNPQPEGGPAQTIGNIVQLNFLNQYFAELARDGQISGEQAKYQWNLNTSYRFSEDTRMKGWTVGGGIRNRSASAIGYDFVFSEDAGTTVPDLSKPISGDSLTYSDVFARWTKNLDKGRRLTVQLNLTNPLSSSDPIPWRANPDGTISQFRNAPTRETWLSTTLSW